MSMDVSEVRALAADLGKVGGKATKLAQQVVAKTAAGIEASAKQAAPVDTGALKNSIGADITAGGLHAEIGPTVHYAPYLEFGTARMAPRPFMGPAADKWQPLFEQAMEQVAEKAFDL